MGSDVLHWVRSRKNCQNFGPREKQNELLPTTVDFPLEVLFIDLIEDLQKAPRGMTTIVVFADAFTEWTEAWAIPDKSALSVKVIFSQRIICRYGLPSVVRTDGGAAFRTSSKRYTTSSRSSTSSRTDGSHE